MRLRHVLIGGLAVLAAAGCSSGPASTASPSTPKPSYSLRIRLLPQLIPAPVPVQLQHRHHHRGSYDSAASIRAWAKQQGIAIADRLADQ